MVDYFHNADTFAATVKITLGYKTFSIGFETFPGS